MRHNHSLSYRTLSGKSLVISVTFFLILLVSSGPGLHFSLLSAQSGKAVTVKTKTETAGQVKGKLQPEVKAPGEGFEEEDFRPKVEEESYGWLLFKTIFVLGLLVGGFYMFYRFISQKAGINLSGQDVVQILSAVPLGPGKFLYIIDLAGKVFLLGVSDSGINMLTEIEGKEDIDRIRLLSSRSTPNDGKNFQDMISSQIGRFVDKINDKKIKKSDIAQYSDESAFDISYLKNQKKRLKNMNGKDEQ